MRLTGYAFETPGLQKVYPKINYYCLNIIKLFLIVLLGPILEEKGKRKNLARKPKKTTPIKYKWVLVQYRVFVIEVGKLGKKLLLKTPNKIEEILFQLFSLCPLINHKSI
jgi:hypothetical protein